MLLANFWMQSRKKLEVHCNIHMDGQDYKMMTLENVEICSKAWYIIHAVTNADFYSIWIYCSQGHCSSFHCNFGTKKPREATRQVVATLSTISLPLVDTMPHKTTTFPSREKVVQMVLSTWIKWKNILVDVKDVAQKAFCGSISLSMLNVIKNQQFAEYIIKRLGDKCALRMLYRLWKI